MERALCVTQRAGIAGASAMPLAVFMFGAFFVATIGHLFVMAPVDMLGI
jgi:hypothetical protein